MALENAQGFTSPAERRSLSERAPALSASQTMVIATEVAPPAQAEIAWSFDLRLSRFPTRAKSEIKPSAVAYCLYYLYVRGNTLIPPLIIQAPFAYKCRTIQRIPQDRLLVGR
jgi:hypothetical protein